MTMLLEQVETSFVRGSHFDDFIDEDSLRPRSDHFLPALSGDDDLMIEWQYAIERFEEEKRKAFLNSMIADSTIL